MKPIEKRSFVNFATILILTFAFLFVLDGHSRKGVSTYLCTDLHEDILVLSPKSVNKQYFTRAKFRTIGPLFYCYPHYLNYVFLSFDQEQIEVGALRIWQRLYRIVHGKNVTLAFPVPVAAPRPFSLVLVQGGTKTDDEIFTSGILNTSATDINDAGGFNNILVRFDQTKFKTYFFSRDRNQIRKCASTPGMYRECTSYSVDMESDPKIKNLPDSYENIKAYIRNLRDKTSPELALLYEYLVSNYFKENCSEKLAMLPNELRGNVVQDLIKRGIMSSFSIGALNNCGVLSEQEVNLLQEARQRTALFRPDL